MVPTTLSGQRLEQDILDAEAGGKASLEPSGVNENRGSRFWKKGTGQIRGRQFASVSFVGNGGDIANLEISAGKTPAQ